MNDELSQNIDTGEQVKKQNYNWLRPWQYKPGQSGNPNGLPKGYKTLKKYAQDKLATMSDEEKERFLEGLDKDKIWEMAEGKPKADLELSGEVKAKIVSIDE